MLKFLDSCFWLLILKCRRFSLQLILMANPWRKGMLFLIKLHPHSKAIKFLGRDNPFILRGACFLVMMFDSNRLRVIIFHWQCFACFLLVFNRITNWLSYFGMGNDSSKLQPHPATKVQRRLSTDSGRRCRASPTALPNSNSSISCSDGYLSPNSEFFIKSYSSFPIKNTQNTHMFWLMFCIV